MTSSDGGREELALAPRSIADFYARAMSMLARLGFALTIDTMPNEIAYAVALDADTASRP
jgi:hypothetical protein